MAPLSICKQPLTFWVDRCPGRQFPSGCQGDVLLAFVHHPVSNSATKCHLFHAPGAQPKLQLLRAPLKATSTPVLTAYATRRIFVRTLAPASGLFPAWGPADRRWQQLTHRAPHVGSRECLGLVMDSPVAHGTRAFACVQLLSQPHPSDKRSQQGLAEIGPMIVS